ncbi:hypothetical protein CDV31_002509 [Fusarium ambrosium]|uniref:Transmembrane protein n=1 Tax=Fusarium ambrosium TaxID=131363 RepID=A0A428UWH7_9HYPO|nr:hypothetical protein CDV31_002509 [Fusarium ambrosium]
MRLGSSQSINSSHARLAQSVERETLKFQNEYAISRLRVRPPHRAVPMIRLRAKIARLSFLLLFFFIFFYVSV